MIGQAIAGFPPVAAEKQAAAIKTVNDLFEQYRPDDHLRSGWYGN